MSVIVNKPYHWFHAHIAGIGSIHVIIVGQRLPAYFPISPFLKKVVSAVAAIM